jgi:hypothetical protein
MSQSFVMLGSRAARLDIRSSLNDSCPMSNLATKAPNFTPETARQAAANSLISRKRNQEREKQILAEAQALLRLSVNADPEETRILRVKGQIDNLLDDMEGASLKERLVIGSAIERLWKLVQPTAGVNKPGRSRRPEAPTPSV